MQSANFPIARWAFALFVLSVSLSTALPNNSPLAATPSLRPRREPSTVYFYLRNISLQTLEVPPRENETAVRVSFYDLKATMGINRTGPALLCSGTMDLMGRVVPAGSATSVEGVKWDTCNLEEGGTPTENPWVQTALMPLSDGGVRVLFKQWWKYGPESSVRTVFIATTSIDFNRFGCKGRLQDMESPQYGDCFILIEADESGFREITAAVVPTEPEDIQS